MSQAIDRWVWYAGWSDKLAQVLGGLNPVAGPYFDISAPEPTGVVAVLAPQRSSLLGLVSVLAPVVVLGQHRGGPHQRARPLPAITLSEALATSDVPGGVVNIITGRTAEVAPWLASHRDVNAIDLAGAADADGLAWGDLELAAAENLKRVLRPAGTGPTRSSPTGPAPPTCRGSPPSSRPRPSGTPRAGDLGHRTALARRRACRPQRGRQVAPGGAAARTPTAGRSCASTTSTATRTTRPCRAARSWASSTGTTPTRGTGRPRSRPWPRSSTTGEVETPVYDIARAAPSARRRSRARPDDLVLAEGIFAAEIIARASRARTPGRRLLRPPPPGRDLRTAAGPRPAPSAASRRGRWSGAAWR